MMANVFGLFKVQTFSHVWAQETKSCLFISPQVFRFDHPSSLLTKNVISTEFGLLETRQNIIRAHSIMFSQVNCLKLKIGQYLR
jgi:hypothetical protein